MRREKCRKQVKAVARSESHSGTYHANVKGISSIQEIKLKTKKVETHLSQGVPLGGRLEDAVLDDVVDEVHRAPHLAEDGVAVLLGVGTLRVPHARLQN